MEGFPDCTVISNRSFFRNTLLLYFLVLNGSTCIFIIVHPSAGNCFHSLLLPGEEGNRRLKLQSVGMYQPRVARSVSRATHHPGGLRLTEKYIMLELTALIFPNYIFISCPPGRHLRNCLAQRDLRKCVFVQRIISPGLQGERVLAGSAHPS